VKEKKRKKEHYKTKMAKRTTTTINKKTQTSKLTQQPRITNGFPRCTTTDSL